MARQRTTCRVPGWEINRPNERYYIISRQANNARVVPVSAPDSKGTLVPNTMIQDVRTETIGVETSQMSAVHSIFRTCLYKLRKQPAAIGLPHFWTLLLQESSDSPPKIEESHRPEGADVSPLFSLIEQELVKQKEINCAYKGEVFVDRDKKTYDVVQNPKEERLVAQLFHKCRESSNGLLQVGGVKYWLLGFQFPTQGGNAEKQMKADLVGLTVSGGLVIFECKRGDNGSTDSPAVAFAQGLDYASHLLREQNFDKLTSGFSKWRDKRGQLIPKEFHNVHPRRNERAEVILLAPEAYFRDHIQTVDPDFLNLCRIDSGSHIRLRMAACDYEQGTANWWSTC